jgi:hypothetical protein
MDTKDIYDFIYKNQFLFSLCIIFICVSLISIGTIIGSTNFLLGLILILISISIFIFSITINNKIAIHNSLINDKDKDQDFLEREELMKK